MKLTSLAVDEESSAIHVKVCIIFLQLYEEVFFPLQNDTKNLDPSYNKMDLDFWDCFGFKIEI